MTKKKTMGIGKSTMQMLNRERKKRATLERVRNERDVETRRRDMPLHDRRKVQLLSAWFTRRSTCYGAHNSAILSSVF
jgi:hypothetical protein